MKQNVLNEKQQLKSFNKQAKSLNLVNTYSKANKIQSKKQDINKKYKSMRELASYHFFHKQDQKKRQYKILPEIKPLWRQLIKNSEYYIDGNLLPLAAAKLYNLVRHDKADRKAFVKFHQHKHNIDMSKYNTIKLQFFKTKDLTKNNTVHIDLNFNSLHANKLTYYPWFTAIKDKNENYTVLKIVNPMSDEIHLVDTLKIARVYLHISNSTQTDNNQITSLRFARDIAHINQFKKTFQKLYNFFHKHKKKASWFWRALKQIEWWPYERTYFEAKRLYALECEKRYGRRAAEALQKPKPIKVFNKLNKHNKKKNWIDERKRKQIALKIRSYRRKRWAKRHMRYRHEKKFGLYYAQRQFIKSNFIPTYKMFISSIKKFMFTNMRSIKFSRRRHFTKANPFIGKKYVSSKYYNIKKNLYIKKSANIYNRHVKRVNKIKRYTKVIKLKIQRRLFKHIKYLHKNKFMITKFHVGYLRSRASSKKRAALRLKNQLTIKKYFLKKLYKRNISKKPVIKKRLPNLKYIYKIPTRRLDLWNTHYIHLYDPKFSYKINQNNAFWDYKLGHFPLNRYKDPIIKNGLLDISIGLDGMNYEKFIASQNEQRLKPRLIRLLKRINKRKTKKTRKVKIKKARKLTYPKLLRVLNGKIENTSNRSRVELIKRFALVKLSQNKQRYNDNWLIKTGKYQSNLAFTKFLNKKIGWLKYGNSLLNKYAQKHNHEIKLANHIQFRAFRWKYYTKRWYSKISRWKRLAIFRRLMRTAWRNYRKLKKNFIFIKLFRANLSHIMGISESELLNKWIKVRRGDNVNTTQPVVTRFNQSLQLKMDGMAMFIGLAPNRPLAQELVKFGGMRINGMVLTDTNYSMALDDILQVDLKVNQYIRSLYKDEHWGSVRKRIRYSRFLQVTWPLMLFTMVRYPHGYELLEESILNERWVRFFIRYFPIRISGYKKAKVKWHKY